MYCESYTHHPKVEEPPVTGIEMSDPMTRFPVGNPTLNQILLRQQIYRNHFSIELGTQGSCFLAGVCFFFELHHFLDQEHLSLQLTIKEKTTSHDRCEISTDEPKDCHGHGKIWYLSKLLRTCSLNGDPLHNAISM